jgi:biopolymer transport protein ExbD
MKLDAHEPAECEIDLTPLIDCVFLLILFFILTSQITVQIEEVDLPIALEGEEQETANPDVVQPLMISVVRDPQGVAKGHGERAGLLRLGGETFTEKQLTDKLIREAVYDREPSPRGRGRGSETSPGGQKLSKLSVLVRADRGVRSEFTRQVFQACAQAGIYKIKVSTMKPE